MKIFDRSRHFLFQEVSATGFGLMRIAWSAVVLITMLSQWCSISRYYSGKGIIPPSLYDVAYRNEYRFSILDFFQSTDGTFLIYILLLFVTFFFLLGIKPRLSGILSVLLLFSFHERNLIILGGGDTVLRVLGFMLLIAPELRAVSIPRFHDQWKNWKRTKQMLPALTMPIWPYRLLLWQYIIIYLTSGYHKTGGDMWLSGTAPAAAFHHLHFSRFPKIVLDGMSVLSPFVAYFTLIFEGTWALLLVPRNIPKKFFGKFSLPLKRTLLLGGLVFHGGIWIFMDVGCFSGAMLAGYFGLLLQEDFDSLRRFFNAGWKKNLVVLYDSHCKFCTRSVFKIFIADSLHRITPVDYHNDILRKKEAPKILFEDLNRTLHVKLPSGKFKTGFDGFRELFKNIPVFWPLVPFLYIPGVPPIGRKTYEFISSRRRTCKDGKCVHPPKKKKK